MKYSVCLFFIFISCATQTVNAASPLEAQTGTVDKPVEEPKSDELKTPIALKAKVEKNGGKCDPCCCLVGCYYFLFVHDKIPT